MTWLVVAGLLGVAAMLWLDARPARWFYSRRAFEDRPVVLPPAPTDQHDRMPAELVRLPEHAVRNLRELEERRGRGR
jgi:hypothetical protein